MREPSCIHSEGTQPMSACSSCKDHPDLHRWRAAEVRHEAARRFLHDAEFHAEVVIAVNTAELAEGPLSRGDALAVAAVALVLRDRTTQRGE